MSRKTRKAEARAARRAAALSQDDREREAVGRKALGKLIAEQLGAPEAEDESISLKGYYDQAMDKQIETILSTSSQSFTEQMKRVQEMADQTYQAKANDLLDSIKQFSQQMSKSTGSQPNQIVVSPDMLRQMQQAGVITQSNTGPYTAASPSLPMAYRLPGRYSVDGYQLWVSNQAVQVGTNVCAEGSDGKMPVGVAMEPALANQSFPLIRSYGTQRSGYDEELPII